MEEGGVMSDSLNYWDNRRKDVSRFAGLKNIPIVQWLFSVRAGDEAFLRRHISNVQNPVVLDVACGVGKEQLAKLAEITYGADIEGYPKNVAKDKGYVAFEYSPPDYGLSLPEKVNIVTCIDLNAHIEFSSFHKIIEVAICNMQNPGTMLIIGEFDNDGVSFRLLKKYPKKYKNYVLGMKHFYFTSEAEFIFQFESSFPFLELVCREEIVCIPPMSHFYACLLDKDVKSRAMKILFTIGDLLLSLLNNVVRLNPRIGSSFRVGYVYKYKGQ